MTSAPIEISVLVKGFGSLSAPTPGDFSAGTRVRKLFECFDLDPRKRGRAYSKDKRQKVCFIAPGVLLILAEPTSGLARRFHGPSSRGAASPSSSEAS